MTDKAIPPKPNPSAKPDAPKAALVKARVRPKGRYGSHREGEIVEVDPKELIVCRHVLVALDAEEDERREAVAAEEARRGDVSHFRAERARGRAGAVALAESARARKLAELAALGITIGVSTK